MSREPPDAESGPSRAAALSPAVQRRLQTYLDTVRREILERAAENSGQAPISDEALDEAVRPLFFPTSAEALTRQTRERARRRTLAKAVIQSARRQNLIYERVALVISLALFVLAVGLILSGAIAPSDFWGGVSRVGSGIGVLVLLLLPFRYAVEVRRENIALDLLGHVLDQCEDETRLAAVLGALLEFVFPAGRRKSAFPGDIRGEQSGR